MTLSANPDAALSPTWRPPKSPLPPHRLAKLANALGVSTPVPANAFSLSRSFSDSSGPMDHFRRSPTPFRRSPTPSTATSSVGFYSPSTSKFMLHVIPPLHLPHDSDALDDDSDMTPPPASASGYHTQFRRGTMVPLYSNFQAQLGAIAKEYALPSTVGLILYLVTTTQFQPTSPGVAPTEEPGPRLSEDIWKHILARVLREEQREEALLPSPNLNPRLLGLGVGARSTPYLPQENAGHLRPFLSSPGGVEPIQPQPTYPFTPAPSTPSSASDIRSSSKSAPPSSMSDEPGTPDTSVGGSAVRADSFDLPGLHSPSLIPILAKVEFDIDRRRAGWYEPWLRSRKANHAKRAGSRASDERSKSQDDEESHGRTPQIRLLIGRKQTASPISLNASLANDNTEEEVVDDAYEPLPEASDQEDEEDEDVAEDATARVSSLIGGKDPLEDVFGSDPDTWADIHSESNHNTRDSNPNITNLAFTGADLSTISDLEDDRIAGREEDEVEALLEQMSRPNLAISMPGSPQLNQKRSSSPSTQSSSRRHVPPPLVLAPQNEPTILQEPTPVLESSGSDTNLAYLESSSPEISDHDLEEEFDEYATRVRSPAESVKRGGTVFGDLDLGLDPSEDFDDSDPHDRRRSQYLMRAQLDEIERTLAQLSPRILKADLEEEHNQSFHSATFSPKAPSLTLSPGGNTRNSDFFPASPRLPKHPDPPSPPSNASWPAVPFSSIKEKPEQGSAPVNGPPSPPQLAVNGITTSAPRSYVHRVPTDQPSAESEFRRRELEEEQSLYPPQSARSADSSTSSPVIPLSPDPFGRYPSTPDMAGGSRLSANQWEFVNMGREPVPLGTVIEDVEPPPQVQGRARSGTTSRFSADSITSEEPGNTAKSSNRATLMSVKSIKKLWRKSSNKDKDKAPPSVPASSAPSSGRASPQPPPQRPERPSQEYQEFPDVPALPPTPLFGRFSPQPPPPSHHPHPSQDHLHIQQPRSSQDLPMPPRISQDQLAPPPQPPQQLSVPFQSRNFNGNKASPIVPTQMLPSRTGSNLDRLHFDQESPYPIRPIRQSPRPASPPPLPPMPDKDRVVRKSILKSWKSSSSGNAAPPVSESRSSIEHQNGPPRAGGRRPSIIASSRTSVTSPDLPPSPQIPDHFVNGKNGPPSADHRQSTRSRLTTSSTDSSNSPPERQRSLGTRSSSPSRSMTSSRSSQETRPSFDVSQFEVVSPKMNSTPSYPYHALDHETDGHGN